MVLGRCQPDFEPNAGISSSCAVMNRRRIPVILQMNAVECGAACLAMVLHYFGRKTRLAECRAKCNPGRNGVSVLTIVAAAREFGLHTKAFSLRTSDLSEVPVP